MDPRAYDQLNVPTEVEAYIPVQKLFLCCCCCRVSGSLRKARDRDPYTKSNQSQFILVTYTVGPAVEAWDLAYQRSYCGIIIDL